MGGPVSNRNQVKLQIRIAATCICVRKSSSQCREQTLLKSEVQDPSESTIAEESKNTLVFGDSDHATFRSGWEVLMGQNEVVNWIRSTPQNTATMRYPGEWKYAGGGIEEGESPRMAAIRELEEEFDVKIPKDAVLRLLSIRQTMPIRNVSNIMFNYIAVASENPWLEKYAVDAANKRLEQRRFRHKALVASGDFWNMTAAEREQVAPEVREIRWLNMKQAAVYAYTSLHKCCCYVNEFQKSEFRRLGRRYRDAMYITLTILMDVNSFPSSRSIHRYSRGLHAPAELRRVRFLWEGMSQHAFDLAVSTPSQCVVGSTQPEIRKYFKGAEQVTAGDLRRRFQARLEQDRMEERAENLSPAQHGASPDVVTTEYTGAVTHSKL
eukprot:m.474520 g.474520  ORF g.474520 m.474520 type:complete len:381 (-) comp21676_c0_seq2:785-1927(-)